MIDNTGDSNPQYADAVGLLLSYPDGRAIAEAAVNAALAQAFEARTANLIALLRQLGEAIVANQSVSAEEAELLVKVNKQVMERLGL